MPKTAPEIVLPFITLNRKHKTPLHLQLYNTVIAGILKGQLKPGDRMPSSRVLAKDLAVSRNVVSLTYEQLLIEGYFVSRSGAGTFVSDLPDRPKLREKRKQAENKSNPSSKQLAQSMIREPDHLQFVRQDCSHEEIIPFQTSIPALKEFPFKVWARLAADIYRNIHKLHLGYDDPQGHWPSGIL